MVCAISGATRIGLTPEVGGRSSRPNHALTSVVTGQSFAAGGDSLSRDADGRPPNKIHKG